MKARVPSSAVPVSQSISSIESNGKRKKSKQEEDVIRVDESIIVEGDVRVDIKEALGNGTFGKVFKIKTDYYDKCLAMKVVRTRTSKQIENTLREVEILEHMREKDVGEFIVENYHSFWYSHGSDDVMCHVFEMLQKSLADVLDITRGNALHPAIVKTVGFQVLSGLHCLHSLGITHCDLKPDNVMFVDFKQSKLRVKLIDFGNSYFTSKLPQGKKIQNIMYRAPETLFGLELTEKIDMWSVGVMLTEMFTGYDLFPVSCEPQLARYIEQLVGLPRFVENGARIESILIRDKKTRNLRAVTVKESRHRDLADCGLDTRAIKNLDCVPELGFNKRTGLSISDDDSLFLDVLTYMMSPNAMTRLPADEALLSPYFRSFDGNYNPVIDGDGPISGPVDIRHFHTILTMAETA